MEVVFKHKIDKNLSLIIFADGRVVFDYLSQHKTIVMPKKVVKEIKEVLCQYLT